MESDLGGSGCNNVEGRRLGLSCLGFKLSPSTNNGMCSTDDGGRESMEERRSSVGGDIYQVREGVGESAGVDWVCMLGGPDMYTAVYCH